MSAKPTFRYNALTKSFYKTLKTELLINGKFETEEKAKNGQARYRTGVKSTLNYQSILK